MDEDWSPLGLAVGGGYLLAALLGWRAGGKALNRLDRNAWRCAAGFAALLGLNKQADLHVELVRWLRVAIDPVRWRLWHGVGREAAPMVFAVAATALAILVYRRRLHRSPALMMAGAGVTCLLIFIAVKLASPALRSSWVRDHTGVSAAHFLEIAGLALLLAGAVLAQRRAMDAPHSAA